MTIGVLPPTLPPRRQHVEVGALLVAGGDRVLWPLHTDCRGVALGAERPAGSLGSFVWAVMVMPNAIYPPRWHKVPPPDHPAFDRWMVALLAVLVVLTALAMVLGGATG